MVKGRKRKIGERTASGRLKQLPKPDSRLETSWTRSRDYGVTEKESLSPLAGYLAGVLCLKRHITPIDLGHFYSFLQCAPKSTLKAIIYGQRIQGGQKKYNYPSNGDYHEMVRQLGRDIECLHALERDQLTVSIAELKRVLAMVPLSKTGFAFARHCARLLMQK